MVAERAKAPVEPGEVVLASVEALPLGPDAVARAKGFVLFVPGAIPGERVRVRVDEVGRKFGRATLVSVEAASPDRAPAFCPLYLACGGCHLQHISPEARRRAKGSLLRLTLERAVGHAVFVGEAEPAPERRYREKITLMLAPREGGGIVAGLFRAHSRELVAIEDCPVQSEAATKLALGLARALEEAGATAWDERSGSGDARAIVVRAGEGTGELYGIVVVRHAGALAWLDRFVELAKKQGAVGLALNVSPPRERDIVLGNETRVLFGADRYRTTVEDLTYHVSPTSFFQTSGHGAAAIVRAVLGFLGDVSNRRVLDVYGGTGLVALQVARRGGRALVVEGNPASIADGRVTAEASKLTCSFRRGRAEDVLARLAREGSRFHAIVLDPPREGCHPRVLESVRDLGAEKVAYVSCDPETLGRDLAALEKLGFVLERVTPIEMFPHAYHVEAVALLSADNEKRQRKQGI